MIFEIVELFELCAAFCLSLSLSGSFWYCCKKGKVIVRQIAYSQNWSDVVSDFHCVSSFFYIYFLSFLVYLELSAINGKSDSENPSNAIFEICINSKMYATVSKRERQKATEKEWKMGEKKHSNSENKYTCVYTCIIHLFQEQPVRCIARAGLFDCLHALFLFIKMPCQTSVTEKYKHTRIAKRLNLYILFNLRCGTV